MTDEQVLILRKLLRKARIESEAAQARFAAPYSTHDSLCAFYEARGRWNGIGMAFDALEAE